MPIIAPILGIVGGIVGGSVGIGLTVAGLVAGLFFGQTGSQNSASIDRDSFKEEVRGLQSEARSAAEYLNVAYGECRAGATWVHAYTQFGDVGGDEDPEEVENGKLIIIAAWSHGPVEEISEIYFDDRLAWTQAAGIRNYYSRSSDPNRIVNSNKGLINIINRRGTYGQGAIDFITKQKESEWTSNHKGGGVAYSYIEMRYDTERFAAGIPGLSAVLKGRVVRNLKTGKNEYNNNTAYCIYDYLTNDIYGGRISPKFVDQDSFIEVAEYCETQKYYCNGLVDGAKKRRDAVSGIASAGRVNVVYEDGKYRATVRRRQTFADQIYPWLILDEDGIVGDWKIIEASVSDKKNRLRVQHIDAGKKRFNSTSFFIPGPGQQAQLLKEDNGIYSDGKIDLFFTTNENVADYIGQIILRESRQSIKVELTAKQRYRVLQYGDIVRITHPYPGWDKKPFWVDGKENLPNFNVRLSLIEYDPLAYTLQAPVRKQKFRDTNLPRQDFIVSPVFLPATEETEILSSGRIVSDVTISWRNRTPYVRNYEYGYRLTSNKNWTFFTTNSTSVVLQDLFPNKTYQFAVRAISPLNVKSPFVFQIYKPVGKVEPPPDISSFKVEELEGNKLYFTWQFSSVELIKNFELRFHDAVDSDFDSARFLTEIPQSVRTFEIQKPRSNGPLTFVIAAISLIGIRSENTASIFINLGDRQPGNIVFDYDLRALGFPGSKTGLTVDGAGDLVTTTLGNTNFFRMGGVKFFSADMMGDTFPDFNNFTFPSLRNKTFDSDLTTKTFGKFNYQKGQYTFDFTPEEIGPVFLELTGENTKSILFKELLTDKTFKDFPSGTFFKDYPNGKTFNIESGSFSPFRQGIVLLKSKIYQFRIDLNDPRLQSSIQACKLTVDVPDIREDFADLSIPINGVRLELTKSFREIRGVQVTVQGTYNVPIGVNLIDKYNVFSGPLIILYNVNSGQSLAGIADISVFGF